MHRDLRASASPKSRLHEGIALPDIGVRALIHAGEPGASVPATRALIERAFNATCWDHAGATEVGAYAYSCDAQRGLHVNEAEFIAEIVDPLTVATG